MDLDPLSVIAPARVKVLLLPVGHVKKSRFEGFVQRLQSINVVRLGDVSPDSRPHRTMFSPLAFPEGRVLYDLSISLPPSSHSALAPFELYRVPLVVIGIADGSDNRSNFGNTGQEDGEDAGGEEVTSKVNGLRLLVRSLENLIDEFSKALVHQILVFDCDEMAMPERIYPVPAPAKSRSTTIKTVMCDLTSRLLAEMATYAKSLQARGSLDSPSMTSSTTTPGDPAGSALITHNGSFSIDKNSRSFSPARDRSKNDKRMSMPVNLASASVSGRSTPRSRPMSPANGMRTPSGILHETSAPSRIRSPPNIPNHERAESHGGLSTATSSASSVGERERSRVKGRIGTVIGAMYLLAGRWPDAVKELVQSAAIARNSSDYVWHAKSMDYVLVCLLMYAWAGMDFRIPENLFPGTEKPGSSGSKSSKHAASGSLPDFSVSKSTDQETRASSLRNLTNLLPDLASNILNLYARAWTFTDDKIPTLVFSQSAIRFAKLLGSIHRSHGTLDDDVLRHLVLNADLPVRMDVLSNNSTFLTKGEIVELLLRAAPSSPPKDSMPVADSTTILAGIASVLAELGYHRRKALVLKQIVSGLLPALVQARKEGAAEMGVHPAASLAALNATISVTPIETPNSDLDDSEQGMRHFLSYTCQSYGLVSFECVDTIEGKTTVSSKLGTSKKSSSLSQPHLADATVSRVLRQASSKAFGSQDLKLDVLRSCISVCEALPDLGGALQYSADLLRFGGSGIAPGSESSDGSPDLAIEEQVRLVNNISRTLSAARQLGFKHPEAEYWDEFLVRGIEAIQVTSSKTPQPHFKRELDLISTTDTKEKNPFIYNPFLETKSTGTKDFPLVAFEETAFRVTLQNLYDFDIFVERVALLADGVSLKCEPQSTIVGPYRTQTIILDGTPMSPGPLQVHGCLAKIRGCRERRFQAFREPWALKPDPKGGYVLSFGKKGPNSAAPNNGKVKVDRVPQGPMPYNLILNVLEAQPTLNLKAISASQAAIMLLEGEMKRMTITLQNTSRTAPADLLLLSFDDPTNAHRQSMLSNKDFSADEFYELELASVQKPSLKWHRNEIDKEPTIDVGREIDVTVEVLGLPGLSCGTIQVDYGHLGIPKADIKETFYTRKLSIPLTITVNASIEVANTEIIILPSRLPPNLPPMHDQAGRENDDSIQPLPRSPMTDIEMPFEDINVSSPDPHCLLLLDLRNSWFNVLTVTLRTADPASTSQPKVYKHQIQSEKSERIPVPFPRLYISNPYAPIPSLNPANKRQFVVSAHRPSPEAERGMRESFWYREALLNRLTAHWKDESSGRSGFVDLRSIKMTPAMLAALKLPDLDISMTVDSAELPSESSTPENNTMGVRATSSSDYLVPISTFLTLTTHLFNRSSSTIQPLLRLQPSLADQPQIIALDLNKKLLVNGLTQRALPTLQPGERATVETGFLVLSYGIYEWRASVEEVFAAERLQKQSGRPRAATGDFDVLSDMGRRTWVAENPCIVVARNGRDSRAE